MYFILLVAQLFQQIANLEHKPPITLGLMACKIWTTVKLGSLHIQACYNLHCSAQFHTTI